MSARADRVREAQQLRAQGLLLREIAEQMGVAVQTVHAYLSDPDLSKLRARQASYAGTCIDCGRPTDGSDGPGKAAERCADCRARYQHEQRRWTPQAIVRAIHEWAAEHGEPPAATDWKADMKRCRRDRPARDAERFPADKTVQAVFGTWNAAIRAAGYTPRRTGHYGRPGEDPKVVAETVRLYRTGLSLVEVGMQLGVSAGCVLYRLQKAGEPRRPAHRRKREAVAA